MFSFRGQMWEGGRNLLLTYHDQRKNVSTNFCAMLKM